MSESGSIDPATAERRRADFLAAISAADQALSFSGMDIGFLDPEAAQAAARRREAARDAAAKVREAAFWRESWRYAKSGPLPMAIVLVDGWRRVTHKWHLSALLLSALEAARQGVERSIQELCGNDPAATQCVRLRLLRWLTGEQGTDSEALARDADFEALSPTLCAGEQAEGRANLRQSPNLQAQHRARSPRSLRDLEDQLLPPAHPAKGAVPAPTQSPASSAPVGPVSSASPASPAPISPAPIDANPATQSAAAHRLSETPE